MWLNKYEQKIMEPFYDFVFKHEESTFLFELNDGAILKVKFDTESEMDNNLEPEEEGYEEFREAYFKVVEIVKDDANSYSNGQLIAINYHCLPNAYKLTD